VGDIHCKTVDIEKQSIALASLSIRDLIIDFVKIRDTDIIKLTLYDICMYIKPMIILFLFTLEHCVEHVYISGYVRIRT